MIKKFMNKATYQDLRSRLYKCGPFTDDPAEDAVVLTPLRAWLRENDDSDEALRQLINFVYDMAFREGVAGAVRAADTASDGILHRELTLWIPTLTGERPNPRTRVTA